MKAKDLRELTTNELNNKLDELRRELFNLKFQQTTHQLKNPSRIKIVRREIARILTILKEKETV
ncbi:MAG TPA: 50S ribosomal protein L29 [Caldisericia bacterium]|jgi:large subunit ribosomal protein L29|nr:50S ribosomal protein L29 [Caldisericia bacterium]HOC52721.1 50S ribosomal protein L29 [Caldisericia bacterium]HPB34215.1 50S ribosomal protein L29 [Caldisericia bacterium]HQL66608.1 50S ribosomal protein L29 [Caldisericia bacterium]HQN48831.1 50S ribosomal protein L29 [Caldisericia bacterium]